jgi:hypothetical protein
MGFFVWARGALSSHKSGGVRPGQILGSQPVTLNLHHYSLLANESRLHQPRASLPLGADIHRHVLDRSHDRMY